jgi:tetratricopeptide (TPR) repeat protein
MRIRVLLLAAFFLLTAFSYREMSRLRRELAPEVQHEHEALYLPSGKGLAFISFRFTNVFSDLLWFRTISYFGKHYRSDHDYRWLNHMCGLITTLDPQSRHIYEFCSLMLAWEAGKPDQALALLDKAIAADPEYWQYYYLRGINYAIFMHDEEQARLNFMLGAKKPDAPALLPRLAAKKLALSSPEMALEFLEDMIKGATDVNQRRALTEHYRKALHERNIRNLEEAARSFKAQAGRWPANLDELSLPGADRLLHDPFGGRYYVNAKTGEIESTSSVERISLFGKRPPHQP